MFSELSFATQPSLPRRFACLALVLLVSSSTPAWAQPTAKDEDAAQRAARLKRIAGQLTDETFELRYHYQLGETLHYKVVHQVTVDTQVEETSQTNKSHSVSLKKWQVRDVSADGDTTFAHSIAYVNMWTESSGREITRYDSRDDKAPPPQYEHVAKMLGKPISVVTINEIGEITHREDQVKQIDLGTGGLTMPLPARRVRIGDEWSVPSHVTVRLRDGRFKTIKTRQRYRLENVQAGVATISLQTQVLTPVEDARVKSQLIQKLSQGTIKFDLDAGRMLSKTLDWDETVIGFNGPRSNMSYLARMTEQLVRAAEVAARP